MHSLAGPKCQVWHLPLKPEQLLLVCIYPRSYYRRNYLNDSGMGYERPTKTFATESDHIKLAQPLCPALLPQGMLFGRSTKAHAFVNAKTETLVGL